MNPAGGGRIGGLIIGTRTGIIPGGGGGIRIPTHHTIQHSASEIMFSIITGGFPRHSFLYQPLYSLFAILHNTKIHTLASYSWNDDQDQGSPCFVIHKFKHFLWHLLILYVVDS